MNLRLAAPARQPGARGFTLLEIMVVACIVGMLASIAVPWFVKARSNAEDAAFINDMRVATGGFISYSLAARTLPPDAAPGVLPTGVEEYFSRRFDWTAPTPIGGQWDWDYGLYGVKAAVSVVGPVRTPAQMLAIDRKIDDGDLSTGNFRARPGGSGYM